MLQQVADELIHLVHASQDNIVTALILLAVLWLVHGLNRLCGMKLNLLGVRPRCTVGLIGIVMSPLLHASVSHLFLNSVPFVILTDLLLIKGASLYYQVTLGVIIISGLLTWLFGRRAIHIGASGLIMGYWSYLLINAYFHPSIEGVILGLLCLYYLGGLALNLVSFERGVSWEGHVFGFLAGVAMIYLVKLDFGSQFFT